jgi:hypothetical protein
LCEEAVVVVRPFGVKLVLLVAACISLADAGAARAATVYFVVAERPEVRVLGDAYVLPLSADADIAHARDLIARGPDAAGAAIVCAEISAGADGINRDVLAAGQPLWDWHVSGFEGFGDMGIELTDGNPTQVGDDVQGWILNTRRSEDEATGHIGFWNYTVVAELPVTPTVPLPAALPVGCAGLFAIMAAQWWPRIRRRTR